MIAAGVQNTGPLATITGVAPKAFLGNYKVFGSPGVNEYTYRSAWIQALTDAVTDGMDIVTLSLGEGDPAIFGPLDQGTGVCGDPVCDVGAQAVENASSLGTLVVAAAGNGGNIGYRRRDSQYPELARRGAQRDRGGERRRTVTWCTRPCASTAAAWEISAACLATARKSARRSPRRSRT